MDVAKKVLAVPLVFDAYQGLIGAPACHRRFLTDYVAPKAGERILDVGCGTGNSLQTLPQSVAYVGIDISEPYIAHAKNRYGKRGTFFVGDATLDGFRLEGNFDRAFAFGVFHHIGDAGVAALVRNVMAMLRPNGTFVTIDPCFVDGQHRIADFLARHDRGMAVRRPDQLQSLLSATLASAVDITVVHDMLRVPYSQVIACMTARPMR